MQISDNNEIDLKSFHTKRRVDTIDRFLALLFIFFVCFPYIQIIPTASYNQPYALILGFLYMLYNLQSFSWFKKYFFNQVMISFSLLGLLFFVFSSYPYDNDQDFKYLTTYLTLPIISISSFLAYSRYPSLIGKILISTVFIWLAVAIIQTFVNVSFMSFLIGTHSDTAEIGNTGGRGVLALAPEPTHYGFHILLIGFLVYLVKKSGRIVILCIIQALVLAKSASALLTLIMGGIIFLLFQRNWWARLAFFFIVGFLIMLFSGNIPLLTQTDNSSRMVVLINNFIRNPASFVAADASVNARIGGAYVSLKDVFQNFLIPNGLAQETWLIKRSELLNNNRDLLLLSNSGPPSGIGIILFQLGFFGMLYIYYMFKQIFIIPMSWKFGWLKYTVFFVALSQYSLATPIFGMLLGIVIVHNVRKPSYG